MYRSNAALCFAFAIVALANPVRAQDGPWYVAVSFGQAETESSFFSGREPPVRAVRDRTSNTYDHRDSAGHIALGYRVNPNIGIEVGYADYGTTRFDSAFVAQRSGTLLEPGAMGVSRKVRGVGVDLVASIPVLDRLVILARGGWMHAEAEARVTTSLEATVVDGPFFSDGQGGLTRSHKSRGGSARVGAGVEWSVARSLGVRLEWERVLDVGDEFSANGRTTFGGATLLGTDAATGKASLDFWSVGLAWRF